MGRIRNLIRIYNEKWCKKTEVAEAAINVLLDGGSFGDWLTFIFASLTSLLERKKKKDEECIESNVNKK